MIVQQQDIVCTEWWLAHAASSLDTHITSSYDACQEICLLDLMFAQHTLNLFGRVLVACACPK